MSVTRRALLWLLVAILITPFAWSTAATLIHVLASPQAELTVRLFLGMALLGSMWSIVPTLVFALPYGAALLAWPRLAACLGWVEKTRFGVALATGAMALPAALVIGLESGRFAGAIRPREFVVSFLCALVGGWIGLLVPRLVLKPLAPGAFAPGPQGGGCGL